MRLFNYDEGPPDWILTVLLVATLVIMVLMIANLIIAVLWGNICFGFG